MSRDVEDGYPLGLISLDRRFESCSRNQMLTYQWMLISSMPVEEVLNVGSIPTVSTKRSTSHCTQPVGVSKYSERRLNPDSNC